MHLPIATPPLALFAAALLAAAPLCDSLGLLPAAQAAGPQVSLQAAAAPATVSVQAVIDVAGELKLNPDGKKVTRAPLKVHGELQYQERHGRLPNCPETIVALRRFESAAATIQIGGGEYKSALADDRRLVALAQTKTEAALWSPAGPLNREELELVESPIGRIVLGELLPGKKVAVEQAWLLSDTTLARLVGLDTVGQNGVQGRLTAVTNGVAQVELAGPASGAVGGVATEMEIKGKYHFDIASSQVTWLGLAVRETRAIGHAEPGFDAVLKVAIHVKPLTADDATPELSDTMIAKLPLSGDQPANRLLRLSTAQEGGDLLIDRRWRTLTNRPDLTVLRLVDRGELIAQCNLSILPSLPAGKHVPLTELQDDIRRSLGDNFQEFVEAGQSLTDDGLRVLRVAAVGQASELQVEWIYYLVSNDQGQRAAFVFTLESKLAETFAAQDRSLVATFQFGPPRGLETPTPAPSKPETPTASKENGSPALQAPRR